MPRLSPPWSAQWRTYDPGPAGEDLRRRFADPPDAFRPVPWLCFNGTCNRAEIVSAIDRMHEQGIRSFILFPIYGLAIEYLSEAWFAAVEIALDHGSARGMTVWIYDDYNWPCGSCAGRLPVERPDLESCCVRALTDPAPVAPGESAVFEPADLQDYLFSFAQTEAGTSRRIQAAPDPHGGKTRWAWRNPESAPVWITHVVRGPVRRKWVANTGAPWTRAIAPADYTDLTQPEAGPEFVRRTHAEYEKRFRRYFNRTLIGFFQDEPQIALPRMSPDMQREFQACTGYALADTLDRLFTNEWPDRFQVRHDYFTLAGKRFSRFLRYIKQWCEERGLDATGHFEGEESPALGAYWDGDEVAARTSMTLPGMDMLFCESNYEPTPARRGRPRRKPGAGYLLTVKLAAAASRAVGSSRVLAEAFGVMPMHSAPVDFVAHTHWLTALGVNLVNDNMLQLSGESFRRTAKVFTVPWWPFYGEFAAFVGRCCLLSTVGRSRAAIAVLYPALSARCLLRTRQKGLPPDTDDQRLDRMTLVLQQTAEALTRSHWDWDLLFEETLAEQGAPPPGTRAILVPSAFAMTAPVLDALAAFARAGGRVLFLDAVPEFDPVGGKDIRAAAARLLSAGEARLEPLPSPVAWPALRTLLEEAVRGAVERPYTVSGDGADDLLTARRTIGDLDVLHVANLSDRPCASVVTFADGHPRELWDPLDGSSRAAPGASGAVELDLAPWQGVFLVEAPCDLPPAPAPRCRPRLLATLDGPWDITRESPNAALLDPILIHPDTGARVPLRNHTLPFAMDPTRQRVLRFEYAFRLEHVPSDLAVVVSHREWGRLRINGALLGPAVPCTLWDKSNLRCVLAPHVRPGDNLLAAELTVSDWFHPACVYPSCMLPDRLDPVLLTGDFSLERVDGVVTLRPPAGALAAGPWDGCGLANYAGVVCYGRVFRGAGLASNLALDLGNVHAAAEVRLNGERLGRTIAPPFRLALGGRVRSGDNRLEIRVASTLAPLFGPVKTSFAQEVEMPRPGCLGPVVLVAMEPDAARAGGRRTP